VTLRKIVRIPVILLVILVLIRVWPHEDLRDQILQSTSVWSADHELLRVTLAADDQ